jgi:hypothetical protein
MMGADFCFLAQDARADSTGVREDIVLLGLQRFSADAKSGWQAELLC